jgi:hypothetical protein
MDDVRRFLIDRGETPMSYLTTTYRHLVVLRANDEGQSITRLLGRDGQALLYRGEIVRLPDIRTMVMALVDRYRKFVERDIFQGLSDHQSLRLRYDVSTLVDDVGCAKMFYSFISDPRNPFMRQADNFLKLILMHKNLTGRYHFVHKGQVVWHAAACVTLLNTIERSRSLLLVLTHLTYGDPGCGADILKHTFANGPGSLARSIVILGQRLCFMGGSQGAKVTARAVPAFIADLWIQHLVLIRPVEVEITRALFGDETAMRYRLYLCPTRNPQFPPEDLSGLLGDLTEEHLGTRLTLQPWREVQACFSGRHIPRQW